MLPGAKASRRPTGLRLQESLENRKNEGKQMAVMGKTRTGASSAEVSRLEMYIAKSMQERG